MKHFLRIILFATVCVVGAQCLVAQPTIVVIDSQKAVAKEPSSIELLSAGVKKAGQEIMLAAKGLAVLACTWSAGRHYQMVKDSENGWKAIFTHKDSVSVWLWTHYRSLCLTVGAAGTSYIGYKLYRYFANKKVETPKTGMVNAETQTSPLV